MREIVFPWFVGVDWGEQHHQVCLSDASGKVRGSRKFSHTGKGLSGLMKWLAKRTGASPESVAVGIERPDGAVVATLLEAGHVVFSLNPRQSNRLRDLYFHAGNKSDDVDARVLAWGLRSNTAVFRKVLPRPELIERLRERTKTLDTLVEQRVRLQQQIRSVLVDYFPQLVELAGGMKNLGSSFFLKLWKKAPTPEKARRLQRRTVERLIREYGIKRIRADQALELLRAEALVVKPGATEAAVARIRTLLTLLKVVKEQVALAEKEMVEILDEFSRTAEARDGLEPTHPDAVSGVAASPGSPEEPSGGKFTRPEIENGVAASPGSPEEPSGEKFTRPDVVSVLRSRPGLGDRAVAQLLGWGYEPMMRGDFRQLRALCGVIPRQIQSGKSERAGLRRAVPGCLQQAAYIMAMGVVRWDPKVAAYNRKMKAEGKKRARRYRSIANRELRLLCAMARNRTFFDPNYPSQRQAT